MRLKSVVLLAFAICCAAAAVVAQDGGAPVSQGSVVNTSSSGASSLDAMGLKKYLLGPGDVLDLRVYNESQFNGPLVVDDEGNIAVPFIETPIHAQCRSDREIRVDIVKALSRYLNKPQVNLRLTEAKSRPPAVVFGAVRSPSRVQMQRRVKLLDLLATSGGVTEAAGGDIQIFHTEAIMCPDAEDLVAVPADVFKPSDPTQVGYDIFSLRELKDGKAEANPVVRPGDIVIVQEALPVYMTGAVRQPMSLYLKNGMQLKQAIAMVGGLAKDAKTTSIIIWRRKKGQSEPEKMIVNFKDINKEKAKDIELQPYDIVDVPDNSGSIRVTMRNMFFGGAAGSVTSLATSLPLRVIY
ncbi:MAG: polysaccharide biosynthesis/export protein [Acidobacteriota bacterium]|jgi:polysaccharide export outer membrane protein|nr:polysaccharide biosynthesis/export protein [Acidobacteriota bacterium]